MQGRLRFNEMYPLWKSTTLSTCVGNLLGDRFISEDPLHGGVRGS